MQKSSLKESLAKTIHDAETVIENELYDRWHIRLHRKATHHVHRLRKRPDHHKDAIAFTVAFLVTAVVFSGWYLISFPRIIDSYKVNRRENSALGESTNPLNGIKERLNESNIQSQ